MSWVSATPLQLQICSNSVEKNWPTKCPVDGDAADRLEPVEPLRQLLVDLQYDLGREDWGVEAEGNASVHIGASRIDFLSPPPVHAPVHEQTEVGNINPVYGR